MPMVAIFSGTEREYQEIRDGLRMPVPEVFFVSSAHVLYGRHGLRVIRYGTWRQRWDRFSVETQLEAAQTVSDIEYGVEHRRTQIGVFAHFIPVGMNQILGQYIMQEEP